jgi:hemolysin activation/secretion protein
LHLTHGLAGLGDGPHTRPGIRPGFTKIRGEARLLYRPVESLSLIFKAMGQYGSGSLYASEEVAFGGLRYGRGFGTAEMTGDSGFGLSFQPEYVIPYDWGTAGLARNWSVTPYLLADYAKACNARIDGQADGELVSAGGGLQIGIADLMTVTLELDKPLNRAPLYRKDNGLRFYAGIAMGIDRALSLIGMTGDDTH